MGTRSVVVVIAMCIGGVSQAAPRWCRDYKPDEQADADQVKQTLDGYHGRPYEAPVILRAAAQACSAGTDERAILAAWQKATGLDEAGAIASLAAHLSPKWADDHTALCKRLPISSGHNKDADARADARNHLFACDTGDDVETGWMTRARRAPDVAPLLDRGVLDADHDELVRLAWVTGEVGAMLETSASPNVLAQYAVAQFDIKNVSYDAVTRQLDAAPYRGSLYAKTVVAETLAHTRAEIAKLDAAVAEKTRDAGWRDAILTAPQKAAAAWQAAAARRKDMLAHTGKDGECSTLTADVLSMVKPLAAKTADIQVVEGELREDPVAGVIIERWAECVGAQDDEIGKVVTAFSEAVPPVPGPRAAAYKAALLAAKQHHSLFDFHDIDQPEPTHYGEEGGDRPSKFESGVVKTMKRTTTGTAVTYVPDKFKYMARDCRDSKQLDYIDDYGHAHYRQECHDAGLAVANRAPAPMTVAAACSAGLAPGRFVWLNFHTPWLVYADKSGRKLVAAYCLPLQ